jgi:hypothetical protein
LNDESLSEVAALLLARREVSPPSTSTAPLAEGRPLALRSLSIEDCTNKFQQELMLAPSAQAEVPLKAPVIPDPTVTLAAPSSQLAISTPEKVTAPTTPMRTALPTSGELKVESMQSSIRLGESRVALSVEVSPGVRCGVELSSTTAGAVRVVLRPDGELDRRALQRDRAQIREAFRARGIEVSDLRIEQEAGV